MEEIPADGFKRNALTVRGQAKERPVYYTEWNENAIFSSYTNDTRKVAAYLVRACLDVEPYLTGSSIWCFTDIFEEFSEFPQEFHGGFGLLTHSGVPKPQYYAMKMMSDLPEKRIDLGEDCTGREIGAAAFSGNREKQILLFRQKMRNLDLTKEKAIIRLELEKEPGEVYLEKIDEENGNPLKIWEEMGSPEDLTAAEREELIRRSKVRRQPVNWQYEDGYVILEAELGVNDVYKFTVKE